MKFNENENYVSPEVEVVMVSVEKGFQASDDAPWVDPVESGVPGLGDE